ncbi:hypothetical protein ABL78_3944 [Leptomonas seymouri]|uniref:Integral membrane bound transporter domain-containing protein n=1 Tax=Leptomonas seymouri TaxID=5684 RepID=A0A0N1PC99_LEPSE|nr:hypothetical protein ABL78_3944 [Leptomonas seymouri]|eukprot:KPI86991.1 hypothetical protein ABL78_3944 [Leptomonas seymouri]
MPVPPPHSPPAGTARGPNSAPNSPRVIPSVAGSPAGHGGHARGGPGSVVTSSHGGRRHVRARVIPRMNSARSFTPSNAGSPTGTSAPQFAHTRAGSPVFPHSSTHTSEHAERTRSTDQSNSSSSSSDHPSAQGPTHQTADGAQREEQQAAARRGSEATLQSILTDPERYRRAVAAGSSNPLHVWDHETAFLKSRYFNVRRRSGEKKHLNQSKQAQQFCDTHLAHQAGHDGEVMGSRVLSDPSPDSLHNGVLGRLLPTSAVNGGVGAGGDSSSSDNHNKGRDISFGMGSFYLPSASAPLLQDSAMLPQRHFRTRNMNSLHAFSWDQRVFLPQRQGLLAPLFDLLATPRFWEKLDWAIRGSVFTILPTLILCLEPSTRHIFPLPTSVVFLAFWTTQPTLGAGLRETFIVLKGFSISLVILVVIIAINPGPAWVTLIILFCCILVTGFVAEQLRRMMAYCFASLLMQYISSPQDTGYSYVGKYYSTILIGQAFGLASFMFPYIRWSSENARRYIVITGDAVSLSVHGACCSFWVESSLLERQLHVARLRQLRHTIQSSMEKAQQGLSEMGYEPHSGVYTTRLHKRMTFLKSAFNIVQSMTLVIEQVAANPALVETPMCREFGERIRDELNLIAAAMDSIILRIVDLDDLLSVTDMAAFRLARARFVEAVSNVRDEVVLSNPDYRTDNSDILLGFFLFSVEELMDLINNFEDTAKPASNLWYLVTFPLRDLQSSWSAFVDLYNAIRIRRSITRRLKEATKLSVCIIIAAIFQVYALDNDSTSPVAGVDIIAFVYRATGGESFQYSTMRMLGTVLGSLTGLLSVQIADGHRPTLYGCALVLTFIGSYVQAAPDFYPLGNALANSVVSIVLQYQNQPNAMTRIQQNCFAILIYFIISSLIWPVRGRTKVNTGLDVSLRMAREATDRLLRNLDLPDSATAVSADVLAVLGEMQKKVSQQQANIPGAVAEPTLDSVGFPEMPWRMLVSAQRKLLVTLFMMRHAYHTFMTSTIADVAEAGRKNKEKLIDNADMIGAGPAAATSISVHWVVLHRISPYTHHLSQLLYEAIEVYLLTLSKATFVPTAELARLRLGMMQCYDSIVAAYIDTIHHELNSSDDDEPVAEAGASAESGSSDTRSSTRRGSEWAKTARQGGSGNGGSGSGGLALENVAGFVPPPTTTFAPHSTTIGGTADSVDTFPKNSSTRGAKDNAPSSEICRYTNSCTRGTLTSSKRGSGHLKYRLTPEERQRLQRFILGPASAEQTNPPSAGAAEPTAAAEPGDDAAAASRSIANASNTAGGPLFNHSALSSTGRLGGLRVGVVDPAMLRNAGIAVREPVYEGPHGGSSASTAHHSTSGGSLTPPAGGDGGVSGRGGRHASSADGTNHAARAADVDGVARRGDNCIASKGNADVNGGAPRFLSDQLSMRSEGGGSTEALLQRNRGSSAAGGLHSSPSTHQPTLLRGGDEAGGSAAPSMFSQDTHAASTSRRLVMKKSKTAKYAMPSVLQMSMVLPAGAPALRNPEAAVAAASVSGSGPPLPSPSLGTAVLSPSRLHPHAMNCATATASPAATSHTAPLLNGSNSKSFVSAGAGTAGDAAGDVFSLGRGARASVRPASSWTAAGLTDGVHKGTTDDHRKQEREGGTADRGEGGRRRRRGPSRTVSEARAAASPAGRSRSAAAATSSLCERGGAEPVPCGPHEPFEEGVRAGRRKADGAAAKEARGDPGSAEVLDAVGSGLLSGPLQQQIGNAASTTALPPAPESLLPAPLPAAGAGDQRAANNAVEQSFKYSFGTAGPTIPEALRIYAEGLAAQQQQLVPPPPAVLGNASFIQHPLHLPVAGRSFADVHTSGGATFNNTLAGTSGGGGVGSGRTVPQPTFGAHCSINSATAPPVLSASVCETNHANFVSAVRRLEFNNCTFSGPLRRDDSSDASETASGSGARGDGDALLNLLGAGGSGGDGGDAYVLTNSDIHSVEAFLFGLRAVITQVEELERYLLEVVHGNEMAKKL